MIGNWKKKSGKSGLVSRLDKIFSKYIRLRDCMPNGMCKCISCGKVKPLSQIDAGHFWSRRHMNTRFDPMNVNGECRYCNSFDGDHLIGYRENLIKKIGLSNFNYLQIKKEQTKKWEDFEIKALIKYYTQEVQRLSTLKGIKI